jgi:glycosyltransferase involved in cell wall biosynthesis
MRYSIITPTLSRPALLRTCQSVDAQTNTDWEHIIMVDKPGDILSRIAHPQRSIHYCAHRHADSGNTCRRNAFEFAHGDYVYYLDDDNYLAHKDVLRSLEVVTANWALFPILRFGQRFLILPPGVDRTDTGNFLVKRAFAQWPVVAPQDIYHADGTFAQQLFNQFAPQYPDISPVLTMEAANHGR